MKRIYALLTALLLTIAATAQTLNVQVGSVTYQFPASQCGEMTYTDGTTLTIMGKTFTLGDISAMTVDQSEVTDGVVSVSYDGSSATVTVAGNIAQYVTPTVNGAHVSIAQSDNLAEEITYTLSGTSTDGEFYMSGSYKATLELNGLTLTNATPVYSGAAIHIQNGKRIKVKPVTGTTNTLVDAVGGSQKGCLYIKGHAEFAQKGTLNVVGNVKHGIKTGEYFTIKNAIINITSAIGDGINCGQFFLMESGTITINGTQDDGIQCDIDDTDTYPTGTGETTDHEDEDSGNIYIEGGTLNISVTADAAKGIKSEGDMRISDNAIISVTTTGAGGEGIESKTTIDITGGQVTINASDDAINASYNDDTKSLSNAGNLTISGGYVYARSTGNDGIDANGNVYIKGGLVYAIGASSPEVAIDANSEEQKKLYVQGGTLVAIGGLERGASLTQSCYSTNSWNKNTWYALTVGSDVFAFKTPSSGGSTMVVSGASQPSLKSGVTVSSGTNIFDGVGYTGATISGGSNVTLSSYTGGNQPGGGGPGGRH